MGGGSLHFGAIIGEAAMGLYDRDYYRKPSMGGVGAVRVWSFTTWLIVINIAVFVVDGFLGGRVFRGRYGMGEGPLAEWGSFSISTAIMQGQVWRLITCQFLHAGLYHLAVNMISLWLLGPVVELTLGARRYLFFYLICGIAGPLMFTALWGAGVLFPGGPEGFSFPGERMELVGASAGIFGVLLAAAYLSPDRMIYIYFFDIPLKYLAWILVGIAVYVVMVNGENAGGQAAHLGGALVGFVLIRHERVLDIVSPKRRLRGRKVKDWSKDLNR